MKQREIDFRGSPLRVVCHDILGQTPWWIWRFPCAIAGSRHDPAAVNPVVRCS